MINLMSSNRQSSGTVDAPTHRFFDGGNFALFVADAGAKAADGYYTHRNLTLFAWNLALWVLNFYVMSNTNNLLSPRDAARFIGVSYSTIKQWILTGKLKTVKTQGGITE